MAQQRTVVPLGTVFAPGGVLRCHVIGWSYSAGAREYQENGQIVVETSRGERVRAGITIDLTIANDGYGDIPVYAEREDATLRRIVVDAARWIDEGQSPAPLDAETLDDLLAAQRGDPLGYVTVSGHAILITDFHFLDVAREWADDDGSQITVDEDEPFRAGVIATMPRVSEGEEFPVYAEYEGNAPVRVIVDLAGPSMG